MRKLVILDLNGLLIDKVRNFKCDITTDLDYLDHPNGKIRIFKRPEAEWFIETLLEKYDVAVWSSTTKPNAEFMLNAVFSKDQIKQLKFVWYRARTQLDPDYGKDETVKDFDTVKRLEQVWLDPYINTSRQYSVENTVIIDDEMHKIRHNPEQTRIIAEVFDYRSYDENYLHDLYDIISV